MIYKSSQFDVDPHIHTVVSGHSWSTLGECADRAIEVGLKGICLTEHSCSTPNGPPVFIPQPAVRLPKDYKGLRIYKGLEANIVDREGKLDTPNKYLQYVEFCIASVHRFSYTGQNIEENTGAMLGALENVYVDMIGHPDGPDAPCDLTEIVMATKKHNKIVEINNCSFNGHRGDCSENLIKIALLCKKHDVRMCVSSDSHFHMMVGDFDLACEFLTQMKVPSELILNYDIKAFDAYINERKIYKEEHPELLNKE